jgi:hypothetical protein
MLQIGKGDAFCEIRHRYMDNIKMYLKYGSWMWPGQISLRDEYEWSNGLWFFLNFGQLLARDGLEISDVDGNILSK